MASDDVVDVIMPVRNPADYFELALRIIAAGGYRQAFEYAEDYDLWLRLSERKRVANLPDVLLHYRRHAGQVSDAQKQKQSFSRDLARMYALRKLVSNEVDGALDDLTMPETRLYRDLQASPPYAPAHLVRAYECMQSLSRNMPNSLNRSDLLLIVGLARSGYLGEGRKTRYNLLKICARLFTIRNDWPSALFARWVYFHLRLTESRWFRAQARRRAGAT